MLYGLVVDGVATDRVQEFDDPPALNPSKNMQWLPHATLPAPTIDESQEALAEWVFEVDGGQHVKRRIVDALPTPGRKSRIDGKIERLELKSMRAMREHNLGQSGALARLQGLEDQIAALRAQRAAL
jgi:hypothetical protein